MSCLLLVSLRIARMSRVKAEKSTLQQRSSRSQGVPWSHRHPEKRREGKRQVARSTAEKKNETRMLVVGKAHSESWMPNCIQLLTLHLHCCFIECGPALCSIASPARGWDVFREEVQLWLDLLCGLRARVEYELPPRGVKDPPWEKPD